MAIFTKTVADSVLGSVEDDLILIEDPAAALVGEISGAEGNDELRFTSVTGQTLLVGANVSRIDRVTIGTGTDALPDASGSSNENIDASAYSGRYSDYQSAVPLQLYGNAGDNVLTGTPFGRATTSNAGWPGYGDNLYGGPGDDTLVGLAGADFLDGGEGNDLLQGGTGNDWLFGRAGDDTLEGGSGADWLYGGLGANRLIGGTGNDTYWLDAANLATSVEEDPNAGTDHLVYLGPLVASLTLPANVEILTLQGAIEVTANDLANQLYADDAAQTLAALGGDDIVSAGGGDDSLNGGAGNDWLYGGAGDDTLVGGDGNDVLVPGAGTNILTGGAGDDVYWLEAGADTVDEAPGEGIDQVVTTRTAVLPANVEVLCVWGDASADVTGNAEANSLWGNAAGGRGRCGHAFGRCRRRLALRPGGR